MSPYEAAVERFSRASADYPRAKAASERILRQAEEEWDAAWADLRQYEVTPGIPQQQYLPVNTHPGPDFDRKAAA